MNAVLQALETERPRLFALAYRMLGSVSEAEDVLQDAALRARDAGQLESQAAWLRTTVTRLCLDQLKSARRQREAYVGPWLPEPLAEDAPDTPAADDRLGVAESVSTAILLLLERLTPPERAAFLLREVFDYPFEDIAAVLGKSEAACRQLFHRAKERIAAARPRFEPVSAEHAALMQAFTAAIAAGDLARLERALAPDAVLVSDGGGRVRAARRPVAGANAVARFLVGVAKKIPPGVEIQAAVVNAQPGLLVRAGGVVVAAMAVSIAGGTVGAVHLVVNPDKLKHLA